MNTYRPLLRPAGFDTLPRGIQWDYVEMPRDISHRRPELPVSLHPHGVISTDKPLTQEEKSSFPCNPFDVADERPQGDQTMNKYAATIEFLVDQGAAIIVLYDSAGQWSGASRIETRSGRREDLYEAGYTAASGAANSKDGRLERYMELDTALRQSDRNS